MIEGFDLNRDTLDSSAQEQMLLELQWLILCFSNLNNEHTTN